MRTVRQVLALPFFALQVVVALVATWTLLRPAQLLTWLYRRVMREVYYFGIVRPKRWVSGDPAWQMQDLQLGVMPPADCVPPAFPPPQIDEKLLVMRERGERCERAFDNERIVACAKAVLDDETYDVSPELREIVATWMDARENYLAMPRVVEDGTA